MSTLDDLFSEAILEAYASAPTKEPVLGTLELRHPAFLDEEGEPLTAVRLVLDNRDWDLKLNADAPADPGDLVEFRGVPIDVKLPEHSDTGVPEAEIGIDNASAELMPQFKRAGDTNDPIFVTYREFLPSRRFFGPEFIIDGFSAKRARATVLRATARLGFFDMLNAAFPSETYRVEDYRGLAQR
ncbi:hypothetical protein sos41_31230 [Alphaproteobacteria bacterium SO-S41]|nr:hypothetical protein sos41_31230 [Alphaproteobacteria bacterium SO-S41]